MKSIVLYFSYLCLFDQIGLYLPSWSIVVVRAKSMHIECVFTADVGKLKPIMLFSLAGRNLKELY